MSPKNRDEVLLEQVGRTSPAGGANPIVKFSVDEEKEQLKANEAGNDDEKKTAKCDENQHGNPEKVKEKRARKPKTDDEAKVKRVRKSALQKEMKEEFT